MNVNISLDYELFFGENNGTFNEILFGPTDRLLELFEKYNIKCTFFVDVYSSIISQKYGLIDEYVKPFENQVLKMHKLGHEVALHIHSHWLHSTYKNGKWMFDKKHYRLHSFENDSYYSIDKIVTDGVDYLNKLINRIDKNYKCVSFRAGGYSFQPHKQLVKVLLNNGIMIDSSICRHLYSASDNSQYYDYRKVPKKMSWYISPETDISFDASGFDLKILEIPLCSDKNSFFKRVMKGKRYFSLPKRTIKGSFIGVASHKKDIRVQRILSRIQNYLFKRDLVSFDSMPFNRIIDFISRNNKIHGFECMSIICHPKMVDDVVYSNIESFLQMNCLEILTLRSYFNLIRNYHAIE